MSIGAHLIRRILRTQRNPNFMNRRNCTPHYIFAKISLHNTNTRSHVVLVKYCSLHVTH